ncbi:hypothetical protein [Pleurocapsa sp. PCC 7327]|uniref:hypothetical protein n=1 Tax=Pleurocapsa sp. PCC 7327 TaxID=118163 RepID=UPI00163F4F83|nr:hypothetical protein [Pleurocapsa sp. PCC 7327]
MTTAVVENGARSQALEELSRSNSRWRNVNKAFALCLKVFTSWSLGCTFCHASRCIKR